MKSIAILLKELADLSEEFKNYSEWARGKECVFTEEEYQSLDISIPNLNKALYELYLQSEKYRTYFRKELIDEINKTTKTTCTTHS